MALIERGLCQVQIIRKIPLALIEMRPHQSASNQNKLGCFFKVVMKELISLNDK